MIHVVYKEKESGEIQFSVQVVMHGFIRSVIQFSVQVVMHGFIRSVVEQKVGLLTNQIPSVTDV